MQYRANQFQTVISDRFTHVGVGANMGVLYKESQHTFKLYASGGQLRCKGFLATLEVCLRRLAALVLMAAAAGFTCCDLAAAPSCVSRVRNS